MSLAKRIGKWILYLLLAVMTVGGICIFAIIVFMIVESRCGTLYTITDHGYNCRVVYCPGGGATGPPHDLEVRVSGGKWDDELLVRAEAADSTEIVFLDSSKVKITILYTFYINPSHFYWRRVDSSTFDLTQEIWPLEFSLLGGRH